MNFITMCFRFITKLDGSYPIDGLTKGMIVITNKWIHHKKKIILGEMVTP